jgi:hypothetical protein
MRRSSGVFSMRRSGRGAADHRRERRPGSPGNRVDPMLSL